MNYVTEIPNIPIEEVKKELGNLPKMFDTYIADGVKVFKPVVGINKLRFLPFVDFHPTFPKKEFRGVLGLRVFIHAYLTPNSDRYLCPRVMKDEECPFCEVFDKYKGVSWDTAKPYSPKPRILCWVYPLMDEMESGVYLWEAPVSVIENILIVAYDDETGTYAPLVSPKNGYEVRFTVSKDGQFNRYSGFKLTKPVPVSDDIVKQVRPFEDVLVFHPYDRMKQKLNLVLDMGTGSSSSDFVEEEPRDEEVVGAVEDDGDDTPEDFPF